MPSAEFHVGTKVCIRGLVNAAQHNGKLGRVSKGKAPEGRLAVKLDDGTMLAVKTDNLERLQQKESAASAPSAATTSTPKERTLKREYALLREFDGSPDPNVLALYYHFNDRAFDCFNASEYNIQMLRYYDNDIKVVLVVPRKILDNDYMLVCLKNVADDEKNTLCEVAFNCGRSFVGISMLLKTRCFACHKPGSPRCQCQCACFCSEACRIKSEVGQAHHQVCQLIQAASKVTVEDENVQLIES
jgi:hypothetical protein